MVYWMDFTFIFFYFRNSEIIGFKLSLQKIGWVPSDHLKKKHHHIKMYHHIILYEYYDYWESKFGHDNVL